MLTNNLLAKKQKSSQAKSQNPPGCRCRPLLFILSLTSTQLASKNEIQNNPKYGNNFLGKIDFIHALNNMIL